MKKNMMLVVLALIVMAQIVTGCCNRCKNQPDMAYNSVGAAGTQGAAGQDAYSGSTGQAYRQAIK